MTGIKDRKI